MKNIVSKNLRKEVNNVLINKKQHRFNNKRNKLEPNLLTKLSEKHYQAKYSSFLKAQQLLRSKPYLSVQSALVHYCLKQKEKKYPKVIDLVK